MTLKTWKDREEIEAEEVMLQKIIGVMKKIMVEDAQNRPRLREILNKWRDTPEPKGFAQQKAKLIYPLLSPMLLPIIDFLDEDLKTEFAVWVTNKIIGHGYLFYYIGYECAATNMPLKTTESLHGTIARSMTNEYNEKLDEYHKAEYIDEQTIKQAMNAVREPIEKTGNAFIHLGIENYPKLKKKKWGIF